MCLHASKPVPYHCQGFVQNHKIQVTECSIARLYTQGMKKKKNLYLLTFHAFVVAFLVQVNELPGAGHPLPG